MRKAPPTDQANGAYIEQLSFFPQPEFCPIRPPKDSNAFKALVFMLEGPITQIEWLEHRLGWRLAATINELVNLGWQPVSKRVMVASKVIASYSLTLPAQKAVQRMLLEQQNG